MAIADEAKAGSDPNLRRTGIPPIGVVPWSAHVCMFYETPEDLLAAHGDYFGAGLADHESCIWALSDPVDCDRAKAGLRDRIAGFDAYLAAGAIELVPGYKWYLQGDEFDPQRVIDGWLAKLDEALARGFAGLRVSGNAFWTQTDLWDRFLEYEEFLDRSFAGARLITLCTYPLGSARALDLLDVARTHDVAVARRRGIWELLEASGHALARRETRPPEDRADIRSHPFPGHDLLTPRERSMLAEIVRGASNKEAARALGISPRTAEFHRTNIMRKLNARNAVELVGIVLGAA
ncbi:MAG TPA: MEDS domain-containing protein [Allosphingosinicella sp.]|nr:MEDS domain-containing protein [Allosphingosinicella sp.]